MTYAELLEKSYSYINQNDTHGIRDLICEVEKNEKHLTKAQFGYIMLKAEKLISWHYRELQRYKYYSSLPNKDRIYTPNFYKVCMHIRHMRPGIEKKRFLFSVINTVKHNRNKLCPSEYQMMSEHIMFTFIYEVNSNEFK